MMFAGLGMTDMVSGVDKDRKLQVPAKKDFPELGLVLGYKLEDQIIEDTGEIIDEKKKA